MKLLFVCLGNSERSTIAEELYNKRSNSKSAKSAGIKISDSPRTELMFKLMKSEGIDISNKPKTQLTREMLSEFDKVIVLCAKKECPRYLLNSKKISFWNVLNPYKKDHEFLLKTKILIEKYLDSIM